MSTPGPTRRDLLWGAAALPVLAALPAPLARAALLPRIGSKGDRVLVVVQLTGGNDGLNTVVPYRDDDYHRARPVLAVPAPQVVTLDDRVGLHPALSRLTDAWERGELAVVQGVGYPDPDRSHFRSMEIWHTGRVDDRPPTSGWLGRSADTLVADGDGGLPVARLGGRDLPLAVAGAASQVPALAGTKDLSLRYAGRAQAAALLEDLCAPELRLDPGALGVAEVFRDAFDASRRLEAIGRQPSASGFPGSGVGKGLELAARLIGAGAGARVLYVTQGGFDTHANQQRDHAPLLRDLGAALAAFQEQLRRQGDAGRVVTFVFSEFGRRVAENASGGTDHGAGAPALLLGEPVEGGVHGAPPDLSGRESADVPYTTDFRRLYAALLGWMGLRPKDVLEASFAPLPLLR